ncbi:Ig-like domain-containing protein [Candidatus Sumerlaeota bacterium]|nr:Ig-like domain-containing protein [Candidatus Sumerlaeota bacterium]
MLPANTHHSESPPRIRRVLTFCLAVAILGAAPSLTWGALTLTSLFPANGATNQCQDTHLLITFNSAPTLGSSGAIAIYKASDSSVVDTIDAASSFSSRKIGGATFNYYHILIRGNTAVITLHNTSTGTSNEKLAYGTEYYVNVDSGVFPGFAGISGTSSWRFTVKSTPPATGADLTIAADGTGDFCTLQGAADWIASGNTTPRTFTMNAGMYDEIVYVSNKHNITVHGASRTGTVIAYPNNADINSNRHMIRLYNSNDWTFENLTLHNTTPDDVSQAEALRSDGYRTKILGCDLKSYQDTLYYGKTSYYYDCYIEGDTDFVWGPGIGYFDNCEIKALNPGYNCWARNGASAYGTVFVDCTLTRQGSITGHYLARTDSGDYRYSHVAYVNCKMDAHIPALGWPAGSPSTVRWWEYQSANLVGTPLDVSGRNAVSRQISDSEAAQMRDASHVLGGSTSWDPITGRPGQAGSPYPANGAEHVTVPSLTLTWTPGSDTTTHSVYFGTSNPPDMAPATPGDAEFDTGALTSDTTYYWRVDEVNATGIKVGTLWSFDTNINPAPPEAGVENWAIHDR